MTLDPVHVDGIAALASEIDRTVEDEDHEDFAERIWADVLDPLGHEGRTVVEPVSTQRRGRVDIESVALIDPPFPSSHGLDAGTLNPTTYRNGAVIDVAHAAMAREPSDHELHRSRSIVGAIHLHDDRVSPDGTWRSFDQEYCRTLWIESPPVQRYAEAVVHSLALYRAESAHASNHVEAVDDILLLDGPIYPKELLRWEDRHPELRERLVSEDLPREVITTYLDLIERCRERRLPIAGFVKNPSSNRITRVVREKGMPAPWFNDAGFFRLVLDPGNDASDLTYTNWFHSRAGTDRSFTGDGGILALDLPDGAEVTFMVIYDPRDRMIYRAEAPAWVTEDESLRERLTNLLLREVAGERGPPRAIAKADRLAKIGRGERRSLRNVFAERWTTEVDRTYDDRRWGMQ